MHLQCKMQPPTRKESKIANQVEFREAARSSITAQSQAYEFASANQRTRNAAEQRSCDVFPLLAGPKVVGHEASHLIAAARHSRSHTNNWCLPPERLQ